VTADSRHKSGLSSCNNNNNTAAAAATAVVCFLLSRSFRPHPAVVFNSKAALTERNGLITYYIQNLQLILCFLFD